jgi:hypothetical protein
VLTTRKLVVATVVVTLVSLVNGGVPANADPGDAPGCTFVICPTEPIDPTPPVGTPDDPNGDFTVGKPVDDACHPLPYTPVLQADIGSQTPPPNLPGAWKYQLCGQPEDTASAPIGSFSTAAQLRTWCAGLHPDGTERACNVVAYWQPSVADPRQAIPIEPPPDGIGRFFRLAPLAGSSPPAGKALTNFPTWFYDRNHLQITGIPPVPLPWPGAVSALAIHLRSWWTVDGHEVCDSTGGKPDAVDRTTAAQERDCGETFTTTGPHTATAHNEWLIILILEFPPYVVVFPLFFDDNVDNLIAREVQADTAG